MSVAPVPAGVTDEPTQTLIELPARRRTPGLRIQVLLGLAVVALFAVISTGALSLWAAADSLRQQRESTAVALAAAASSAISASVDPTLGLHAEATVARISPLVRQLLEAGRLAEVSVLDNERRLVVARPPREPNDQDPPVALAALAGVPSALHYRKGASGVTQLLAYAPVMAAGQVVGLVRLVIEAPPPMMGFLAKSGSVLAALALGNAILLVALGYVLITSLVVRPLRQVEQATAALAKGDFGAAVPVDGPRELVSLAESFNRMATSLAISREQLIRTEKLASLGQLAAGVAHEIGNPLAAILGYADILKQDAEDPEAAHLAVSERQTIAGRIKSETERIHRTISDLLEYSRPSRQNPGPTDVLMAVKAARDLVAPMGSRLRNVRIEIEGEQDASLWPLVVASAERLQQVFVNLLLNAADAMQGEGKITLSTRVEAKWLRVLVKDSGPGVPEHLHRRIFDPFFTTKEPGQGTGLGLSICRSMIESYEGTLELQAHAEGAGGATFVLSLPLSASV